MINSENSIGSKLQKQFGGFCDQAASMFREFDFLNESAAALTELRSSIVRPFNIAVFGRMKTGKSSLINALLGENLAITGVTETTATINVITHSDSADELGHFTVHWKDAIPQILPLEELSASWSGKSDNALENVRRTSWIELYSALDFLKFCEITDTPGTGSEAVEHEEVTQSFLEATSQQGRKADAVIYVFPPVGRESDLDNLETFRQNNCIPGSDPYNSIAVLHKWDHIYWEERGNMAAIQQKTQRLYDAMKGVVAEVLPVSAPIALAAKLAPEEFFANIYDICKKSTWEELERVLARDTRWNRDEQREKVLAMYDLPWSSFQCIIMEAFRHPEYSSDINEFRKFLLKLSGIEDLLSALDRKFFKHSEIIRQKQKYAEINRIKEQAYKSIQKRLNELEHDKDKWDNLFNMPINELDLEAWIANKRKNCMDEKTELNRLYEELDSAFINSSIPALIKDEEVLRWSLEDAQNIFTMEQIDTIKSMFELLAGCKKSLDSNWQTQLDELNKKVSVLSANPRKKIRDNSAYIKKRISDLKNYLAQ